MPPRQAPNQIRTLGLKANRTAGEEAIRALKNIGAFAAELKPEVHAGFILIPLRRGLTESELNRLRLSLPGFELVEEDFSPRFRPKTFLDALAERLPKELLPLAPRSMDVVGHVAVVTLPPALERYGAAVGEALLEANPGIKAVFAKAGPVAGLFRVRGLRHLAGDYRSETLHRENGCVFAVDVAKVYFSPRLARERLRVARQVEEGETVVDLFAGVGPFAIAIARRLRRVEVYALDANPDALRLLERNIKLNRVEGKVKPLLADASTIVERGLRGVANRAIMNLPEKAEEFLGAACAALKPDGGVIHFYCFSRAPEPVEAATETLKKKIERHGRRVVEVPYAGKIKEVAPRVWHVVVDARVQ